MKLPSKLTSFEQFLFFDDYPSNPNTIGCRLNFSGRISEPILLKALELVCERNPMFKTSLVLRGKKPVWDRCLEKPLAVRLPDEFVDRPYVKKIDLDSEQGGQLHWAATSDRASLNFLTHHATADGMGGLQVVSDWMSAYHALESSDSGDSKAALSKIRKTNLQLWDARASYGFCRWKFLKTLPRQGLGLFGVKEYFANSPVTLDGAKADSIDEPIPDGYPGIYSREFADVGEVRQHAGLENATTNDLIVQCIFIAVAKWRRNRSIGNEKDLIRIMIPINLRTISDRYLPASHRSSMVSLDRKQERCNHSSEFLNSIRFQMNVIKANELGYTFLHCLNFSRWFPGGIRRFANPDRVGCTLLVTNLGEPFKRVKTPADAEGKLQVGGMVLDSFELLAPLRPNTQAGFAVHRYAGKTVLSLTYDNRALSVEDAKELTNSVCEEFRHKVNS